MGALMRLGMTEDTASPRDASGSQIQTADAFGYKWARLDSYGSPEMMDFTRAWLVEKYCGGDRAVLEDWLAGPSKIILDAGCGSGYSAICFFGDLLKDHDYLGVDISNAVDVAKTAFRDRGLPGDFLQADMTTERIPDASVDLILAEGTLHHTDDTGAAIVSLAKRLTPGGRFLFYVYARKAPIREYADDLVREEIAELSDEDAWERLKPLSALGVALGELNATIDVPEEIPYLGIPAGPTTIQRLVYYAFIKAFYRADWTFDEMHHVNFDWYRPSNARRHTEGEVRGFVTNAGLEIERFHAEPSGYSVVARSPSDSMT